MNLGIFPPKWIGILCKYLPLQLHADSFEMLQVLKSPFHWTAIPLRFEILVKMTRIVAETARAQ